MWQTVITCHMSMSSGKCVVIWFIAVWISQSSLAHIIELSDIMEHHLTWGVSLELYPAQHGLCIPTGFFYFFLLRSLTNVELGILANVENVLWLQLHDATSQWARKASHGHPEPLLSKGACLSVDHDRHFWPPELNHKPLLYYATQQP